MKPNIKSYCSLLALPLVLFFVQPLKAQWLPLSGLYGEPVYNVVGNGTKAYAMTSNGVLSTSTTTTNWNIIPPLYLTNVIENLSASGDTIVAYANPSSYVSNNNGNSWSTVPNGPTNVFAVNMVSGAGKLFLPTFGDYLYYSINGGGVWNQINASSGLTSPNINSISIDGSKILVGTDDGLFISTNGGGIFTPAGLQNQFINVVYIKDNYLFCHGPNGLKQSTNQGASWINFDPAIPYSDVTEFLVSGNKVFASTSGILMSSNVNAPTWSQISFNTSIDFNFSLCKAGTEILVGSNRGVFSSADNGITWSQKNNGLQTINVSGITTTGTDTVYAGASIHGISKFNNNNWNYSGLALLNANHLKTVGNAVYAASDFGIYKSVNGGANWIFINNVGPNPVTGFCQRLDVKDTLILGACLQSGVLRSGDNGASWSFSTNGLNTALLSSITISGANVIAGSYNDGLFLSTDAGINWSQIAAAGTQVNDLTSIGNSVVAVTATGNYYSSDAGVTWTLTNTNYYEDLFSSNGLVFASGPNYVHISSDSGQTFPEIVQAPANVFVSSVTASNDFLYVGTINDGVWKRSISEILNTSEMGNFKPFALMIPNIISEEAKLVIDVKMLSESSELWVRDMRGRIVYQSKIHSTETTFKPSGMVNGNYLYTILNDGKPMYTGKIVIGKQ